MDGRTGYTLSYAEMVEDANGLYQLDDVQEFDVLGDEFRTPVGHLATFGEAVAAWKDWICDQGYAVTELPRTSRTLGWGCG